MEPCLFCAGEVIVIRQDVLRTISGIKIIRRNENIKKCTACGQHFYPGRLMLDMAEEARKLLKQSVYVQNWNNWEPGNQGDGFLPVQKEKRAPC